MKKRLLCLVLVLCMVLTLLPISAFAADTVASGTCGENLTWTLDSEGTLTISGTGAMNNYSSTYIGGEYITTAPWGKYAAQIKSVEIGNGVTSIGDYAFYRCSNLTSVTIPDGVTSIGRYAFRGCSSLTGVTIPDSVTSIGIQAFCFCSSLTSVTIPDSVTSIGEGAFSECDSLAIVTISGSVTSIVNDTFSYCSSLTSVTIPDGVTSIGGHAFAYCSSLESVTIPDGVTSIGESAFTDCSSLGNVTMPGGVTSIGMQAFQNCSSLTSVTIPDSAKSIGSDAFYGCSSLASVTIGNSVTSIGSHAFHECSSLESVTIPDSVTSIGDRAFSECRSLESVTIGNRVTSIGEYVFAGCSSLTEIYYNAKAAADLTRNSHVFFYSGTSGSGIKVTIGDNVKKIPNYLFDVSDSSYNQICELVFTGYAPTIGESSFRWVTAAAYYPYGNDSWTYSVMKDYGGSITWKPYSNAEANSVSCSGKTSYFIGDRLDTSSISVTIYRADGCVETYSYSTGEIALGEYDMTKAGNQSITLTCKGETTQLNICVHDLVSDTTPAEDYPESAHDYENNLNKTYTYVADGAYSLDVTFSINTETEENFDYIYVNGAMYTGKSLAGQTIHINGDTLTIRIVSDNSYCAYGFSIDSIIATYTVHVYTDTVVAPTCTEKGYTTYTCACGDSYVADEVDAIGHDFGEWTVTTVATCTEKGEETHYCNRCDASETREAKALGHDLVHHDGKAATCTEKGWEAYDTCSRCDYTTYKEIPATGHSYTTVVTAPTCTEKGYTTYTCACGDSYVADYVDALDHDFGAWKVTTAATCTEKGEETHCCSRCDATETREVAALGHDLVHHDDKAASCMEKGWEAYDTCSRCDYSTYKEIPATGHNYTAVVTAPTCIEKGYTTYTCHCGDSYVADEVKALGHDFGEWTVTTAASCTENGVETRCCSRCDATETREVNALGHDLVHHDGKAASCMEKGWEAYDTCSRCDYSTYKEIPATGHNYTAVVTAPTCTEKGYTTYTCTCGDSYVADYKDAIGHNYGAWKVTTAATCTEKGEETHYCSRCDATETREVNALGHDLVHHDGKAASCTENGWEAYDTCSRCDYTTYKEIPATGHKYSTVVTAPTCTETGYTTYTCVCGDSYVAGYKDALGHDYVGGKCTRCGDKDPNYVPENPFVDVSETAVYYDAVIWASENEITGGYGNNDFRPNNPCTRAQVVTFLWRAKGCPEPASNNNPFSDVSPKQANGKDNPYYTAILWAAEQGITTGYAGGLFKPNDTVTRAQFVTFLWRADGKPATSGSISGFADASQIATPYQQAVAWAVEKGITTGYNDNTFRPNAACTRWAVVLFMYRDLA